MTDGRPRRPRPSERRGHRAGEMAPRRRGRGWTAAPRRDLGRACGVSRGALADARHRAHASPLGRAGARPEAGPSTPSAAPGRQRPWGRRRACPALDRGGHRRRRHRAPTAASRGAIGAVRARRVPLAPARAPLVSRRRTPSHCENRAATDRPPPGDASLSPHALVTTVPSGSGSAGGGAVAREPEPEAGNAEPRVRARRSLGSSSRRPVMRRPA